MSSHNEPGNPETVYAAMGAAGYFPADYPASYDELGDERRRAVHADPLFQATRNLALPDGGNGVEDYRQRWVEFADTVVTRWPFVRAEIDEGVAGNDAIGRRSLRSVAQMLHLYAARVNCVMEQIGAGNWPNHSGRGMSIGEVVAGASAWRDAVIDQRRRAIIRNETPDRDSVWKRPVPGALGAEELERFGPVSGVGRALEDKGYNLVLSEPLTPQAMYQCASGMGLADEADIDGVVSTRAAKAGAGDHLVAARLESDDGRTITLGIVRVNPQGGTVETFVNRNRGAGPGEQKAFAGILRDVGHGLVDAGLGCEPHEGLDAYRARVEREGPMYPQTLGVGHLEAMSKRELAAILPPVAVSALESHFGRDRRQDVGHKGPAAGIA